MKWSRLALHKSEIITGFSLVPFVLSIYAWVTQTVPIFLAFFAYGPISLPFFGVLSLMLILAWMMKKQINPFLGIPIMIITIGIFCSLISLVLHPAPPPIWIIRRTVVRFGFPLAWLEKDITYISASYPRYYLLLDGMLVDFVFWSLVIGVPLVFLSEYGVKKNSYLSEQREKEIGL